MDNFRAFFLLTIFTCLFSCSGQLEERPNKITSIPNISLNNFKIIPSEIKDFFCCYSETNIKFKNEDYLFACNSDSIAFISVEQKMTRLKLISTSRSPGTFTDTDHKDVYSNGFYTIIVDTKYIGSNAEESWWNKGTIKLEDKNGNKLTKKLYGLCGYRKE